MGIFSRTPNPPAPLVPPQQIPVTSPEPRKPLVVPKGAPIPHGKHDPKAPKGKK